MDAGVDYNYWIKQQVSLIPAEFGGGEPGDFVEVGTRRGSIRLKSRAERDVPEGMVFIPFCFAEASANMLTNPKLDPLGKIPEFKYCAARVEKADVGEPAEAAE